MLTIKQAFDRYTIHLKETEQEDKIILTRSAILRFLAPAIGGPKIEGSRSTVAEIEAGLTFLDSIECSDIENITKKIEVFFDTAGLSKAQKRQPRSYIKSFTEWIKEKELAPVSSEEDPFHGYKFYESRKAQKRGEASKIKPMKSTERTGKYSAYALGKVEGDFINEKLKLQLEEYDRFYKKKSRKAILDLDRENILAILGWAHRKMDIALDKISIEIIVPFTPLKVNIDDNTSVSDYILGKEKARQEAERQAEVTVENLEKFFNWRANVSHELTSTTRNFFLGTVKNLAKYLYYSETDRRVARNFEDIPVIQLLRAKHNQLRTGVEPQKRYYEVPITWHDVVKVRERLRIETHIKYHYFGENNIRRYDRTPKVIGGSLQKFLLFSFFTLIPPDRQRTFKELEIGRTLRHGILQGSIFTDVDRMKNPSEAKFYIFLKEDDYKTGKFYKEWEGELPNHEFPDGKTWYQYIERWLYKEPKSTPKVEGWNYGLRETMNPDHNKFFLGRITREPLGEGALNNVIKTIFNRFTGTPVTPHTLRHIYNTYIRDIDASESERVSTAYWLHQSKEVADKRYSHQERSKKLQPGLNLITRINKEIESSLQLG